MWIKSVAEHEVHERVRAVLQRLFPGDGAPVPDEAVAGVVQALWQDHAARLKALGLPDLSPGRLAAPLVDAPLGAALHPLYLAHAAHHRVRAAASADAFESEFLGDLPMVRVPLPAALDGSSCAVLTAIGAVDLANDHLAGSVAIIADQFGAELGYAPARVDLITPARLAGTRFGAIAVYLGYREAADAGPSFYVLEAGTAPGVPRQLYLGAAMDTVIVAPSGYQPTPFSAVDDTYRGWLVVGDDEPVQLVVQSSAPGLPFYIQVTVRYERVTLPPVVWPAALILEAAARVAALADALHVPSGEPVEGLLAAIGRELPWVTEPAKG